MAGNRMRWHRPLRGKDRPSPAGAHRAVVVYSFPLYFLRNRGSMFGMIAWQTILCQERHLSYVIDAPEAVPLTVT